jgi:hypothetical protein
VGGELSYDQTKDAEQGNELSFFLTGNLLEFLELIKKT